MVTTNRSVARPSVSTSPTAYVPSPVTATSSIYSEFHFSLLRLPLQVVLGHTEDALSEVLNHFYFVSAHIISESPEGKHKVVEERFTSLCYAGHLPGYTMNANHHGLVFSINTLSAKTLVGGKTRKFRCPASVSGGTFVLRNSVNAFSWLFFLV